MVRDAPEQEHLRIIQEIELHLSVSQPREQFPPAHEGPGGPAEGDKTSAGRLMEAPHPHVVQLYGCFKDARYVYLVMELCDGGDLFRKLKAHGPFTEDLVKVLVRQLLLALAFLHGQGILHRDLKLSNLLLGGKNRDVLKVADFGLAAQLRRYFLGLLPAQPFFSIALRPRVALDPLFTPPPLCHQA